MRRISLVALALASAIAALAAGGASAAPQKCVIQLRVNVFGTSPGGNWALQGGLNAGSLATLRAVGHGCTVDHIRGRWISGATSAIAPKRCGGGPPPCVWKVRGNRQSAAAFQAFATSSGTGARSNVVRVAWAGSCTRVGEWENRTEGIGVAKTVWTIETGGVAREGGGGNATGMATLDGHVLRITWLASDQVTAGVYEWTLGPNCKTGSGTLRFTGPPSRVGESHPSKVTKESG